ncbi:MAG TPA: helix-turn-helix domain-containing protein [Kofleriaceae bacterium]|jgi:methylphosphotriester-DNA--protein-cysteine methyltransferase|nr:helix-turn-helix domain-containing protein [Kofleriaceae bacterium]
MRIVAPSPVLAPFVRELMIVEVGDEVTRVRLPEPGFVLGLRYRGAASYVAGGVATALPDATLSASGLTARRMRTSAGGGVVLARFHPGGAAQFFRESLHELRGATVALDDLVPHSDVDRATARVQEAATDAARTAAIEALLVARLRPEPPDAVVAAAVRAITDARGAVQIRDLARRLAISQDPLEKRFRRAVGMSPKQLARLIRLRRAIDAYRPGTNLARLAIEAGFYDQAHFSRELRTVIGEPPRRFLVAAADR